MSNLETILNGSEAPPAPPEDNGKRLTTGGYISKMSILGDHIGRAAEMFNQLPTSPAQVQDKLQELVRLGGAIVQTAQRLLEANS